MMIASLIIFIFAVASQFTNKLPHYPLIAILGVLILGAVAFAIWSFVRGVEGQVKHTEG